jgi:hypothetical protein
MVQQEIQALQALLVLKEFRDLLVPKVLKETKASQDL